MPQQIASGVDLARLHGFVKSGWHPVKAGFESWTSTMKTYLKSLESAGMLEFADQRLVLCPRNSGPLLLGCFASDPDIFVLDEPTTGMMLRQRAWFCELMHHSASPSKKSVLMITHDPEEALTTGSEYSFGSWPALLGDALTSMIKEREGDHVWFIPADFMQRPLLAMVAMSLFPVLGIFFDFIFRVCWWVYTLSHVSAEMLWLFLGIFHALNYDHCHYSWVFLIFADPATLWRSGRQFVHWFVLCSTDAWWWKSRMSLTVFVCLHFNHYGWTGDALFCDCLSLY